MSTFARTLLGIALGVLLTSPLPAQGRWVRHQDPCKLSTGHPLVGGAILYLKQAIETRYPDQRDGRLAEALRVLTEALTDERQHDNAAVWYFLGRYYTEMVDPAGADSAFRRAEQLQPICADDIAQYRDKMAPLSLNEALRTWGSGQNDSAAYFFHLAARLNSDDAEVPLYLSIMYATSGALDSAAKYLAIGLDASASDTTAGQRLKQAQLELARAYETRAYQNQAIIRAPLTRMNRDSMVRMVGRDSTRLATMLGRVQEIYDRGRQLDPESRGVFEQESTTVATRLGGYRAARDSLTAAAIADSVDAMESLAPALDRYRAYLDRFPDDVTAAMNLARLYSAAGDSDKLSALIDRIVVADNADASALVQGGMSLFGEGQHVSAARMLEAALKINPNHRTALLMLCRSYYALQEQEKLMPVARRLAVIDPLNSNAVRMLALGWALAGDRDSVGYYVAMADTGIVWHVNVQQFMTRKTLTRLTGSVRNLVPRPLPATTLLFEFLDSDGNVLFSFPVEVPALEPRARSSISIREQQGGSVAWRYRRQ
ncbi:MAG: hypothetical protein IH965_06865 [Gemmatimonadetes bacterium]|nr:hypothetical protein [Gemmatimonadota bacterium]